MSLLSMFGGKRKRRRTRRRRKSRKSRKRGGGCGCAQTGGKREPKKEVEEEGK